MTAQATTKELDVGLGKTVLQHPRWLCKEHGSSTDLLVTETSPIPKSPGVSKSHVMVSVPLSTASVHSESSQPSVGTIIKNEEDVSACAHDAAHAGIVFALHTRAE